jgi:hypothetical protein
LDKPLHVIYKVSKLAYRIWVIVIANERVKKKTSAVMCLLLCFVIDLIFNIYNISKLKCYLCRSWDLRIGDYGMFFLQEINNWNNWNENEMKSSEIQRIFRRRILPPLSGSESKPSKIPGLRKQQTELCFIVLPCRTQWVPATKCNCRLSRCVLSVAENIFKCAKNYDRQRR